MRALIRFGPVVLIVLALSLVASVVGAGIMTTGGPDVRTPFWTGFAILLPRAGLLIAGVAVVVWSYLLLEKRNALLAARDEKERERQERIDKELREVDAYLSSGDALRSRERTP